MPSMASSTRATKSSRKQRRSSPRRISHRVQPDDLDLVSWQRALRVQAGEDASFQLRNLEDHPVFSTFEITNRESERSYRVAIRGEVLGVNFCSCPDFTTSQLGICKHVAFVLHRLRRTRAAAKLLKAGYSPPYSEIAIAYDGPPRLRLLLGTDCPPALRRRAAHDFPEGELSRGFDQRTLQRFQVLAERAGHELRVYDDAQALLARWQDDATRILRLRKAFPRGPKDPGLRRLLKTLVLHPYQCEGAWFLAERGRSLLADDMGLGKTAQAVAAALLLERCSGVSHVLLVAPASICGQWAQEILRFTGREALVVRGMKETRSQLWARSTPTWKIVTYETLARDREQIDAWGVDLLILDEAQRVKNYPTQAAQAVRRLDAPLRFVLTGTPIENRLDELHSLIEILDPSLLGPLFVFKDRHTEYEPESSKVIGYRDLDQIARDISPVVLRRTRAQVMDQLPGRTVVVLREPLTPEQAERHEEDRQEVAKLVLRWRRRRFLTESEQNILKKLLTRMRMVCDDLRLLDPKQRCGPKLGQVMTLVSQELADPTVKMVIFSSWIAMHGLIIEQLAAQRIGYAFLHGGVPASQRPELITRFRDDARCRVFLSTDCGATGLNLQSASVLINVDLPWNPAVREQRISRIHRQGQRLPVRIYDLVAEDGIEQSISQLLTFKSGLAAGVLDGQATWVRMEGSSLQRFMRSVDALTTSLDANAPAARPAPAETAEEPAAAAAADSSTASPAAATATSSPRHGGAPASSTAGRATAPDLGATLQVAARIFADLGRIASQASLTTDDAGRTSLHLPLPDRTALSSLLAGLAALQRALGPNQPKAITPED